jgi:ribulose-phosphate 3-epimerase
MHIIAPSILSADFAQLANEVTMLNNSAAQWIHLDIMDGVFVPNISFGIPVTQAIIKHSKKFNDVHLMIVEPQNYIDHFHKIGTHLLTIHYEACTHLHRTLQAIKATGMKAGVALNPHTPVALLSDIIDQCDLICIMSVNPGFGGQKFIENTYSKISQVKDLILQKNTTTLIEIDGGVTLNNYKKLIETGADVLVAGNTVFGSQNPSHTIQELLTL